MSESDQLDVVLRLLLAFALGSAIGFEREWRGHEAGLRTMGLVAIGSAIFGEVSTAVAQVSDSADASRIAAGVVQGIGFLGAGIIFQRGPDIRGLTTAVTIWAVAGIGLAVAIELWLVALLVTAFIIAVLELQPLSDWVLSHSADVRARKKAAREGLDVDLDPADFAADDTP